MEAEKALMDLMKDLISLGEIRAARTLYRFLNSLGDEQERKLHRTAVIIQRALKRHEGEWKKKNAII